MVVVKNSTAYTYGDHNDGIIIIIVVAICWYEYLDCSVKLTEQFVLHFQEASI
jgi:hypothetical protein